MQIIIISKRITLILSTIAFSLARESRPCWFLFPQLELGLGRRAMEIAEVTMNRPPIGFATDALSSYFAAFAATSCRTYTFRMRVFMRERRRAIRGKPRDVNANPAHLRD